MLLQGPDLQVKLKKEPWKDDYSFSTGTANLDELLELDWVRSESSVMNPKILNGYQLKLENEPVINGKSCWVISFSQENPTPAGSGDFSDNKFSGKITITKDDYTVLKIEGKGESSKNSRQGKSLAVGKSVSDFLKNVSYNFIITYENLKPALINLDKKYESAGNKIEEKTTLKVNRVLTTNIKPVETREYFTGE